MVHDDKPKDRAGGEPDRSAPARATGDITLILSRIEQGDPSATPQLLPLVYEVPGEIAAADLVRDPAKDGDQVSFAGSCRKT